MKSILSFLFVLAFIGVRSQNNLVVFSENGEKFFLIVNGVKQNIEAETNVKVTDLIQPTYKAKIVFEDKAKGTVDQTIYFMDGAEPVKNHEFVYAVKVNKKAGYKVRPVSAVSIAETKADPSQTVVHYSTVEPTPSHNNVVTESSNVSVGTNISGSNAGSTNVNVTETTTQTQVQNGTGGGANVGINMNGLGVNINISDNMGGANTTNQTTTTSQTVVTRTSSSGYGAENNTSTSLNTNAPAKTSTKTKSTNALPGYTGATGCAAPMSASEFSALKTSIETKNFEDSKIKIAKQVIDNNCLLSSQVKEIMMIFSFEETRLDLAKYAYGHTYDIGNYYKLNDAFKFEASIDELDQYIKENKTH